MVATSDGDGDGAVGAVTACCCCGWVVDWLLSAAIRVAAALLESVLADSPLLVSAPALLATCFLAVLADFTGAGVLSAGVMAAAGAGGVCAAGGVAGVLASGVMAWGAGAGAGSGAAAGAGVLLAVTTGLECEPCDA